jgi:sarcosine oxidase
MKTADVIVVGLGAAGAASLYQLARRGVKAIGVDRFSPPHGMGSSHGETRITRIGVGEGAAYPPLARRSHEIWRELEAKTGEKLLLQCGMLALGQRGATMHGRPDFIGQTIEMARRFDVEHELLDAAEIGRRYPQFELVGDEAGYFEPGAGLVYPERCVGAQLALAKQLGAEIVTDAVVTAVEPDGDGVRVVTASQTYTAAQVIVAAGAWNPGLIGAPLKPLSVQPQALHWFAAERPEDFGPDRFPVFIWTHGQGAEDLFYGFPIPPDAPTKAVKVATEAYQSIASPDGFDRTVPEGAAEAVWRRHVFGRLTGISPTAVKSAACLYTMAPDGDFVIDRIAGRNMIVASACSGHGFKHSAALGEMLAEAAVSSDWTAPPGFSLDRFN